MGKNSLQPTGLPITNTRAAGIDIGSTFHVVAVPVDICQEPVQTFQSFTGDLKRLAIWLKELKIRTVAMESTGVYWVPVYEILQEYGFDVVLANARETRSVPGRKTDVNDAQWIQKLHACGLLRASFHPERDVAALRCYLRTRERLLDYAAAHIQHMQKALIYMNIQLHHVIADITGVTGMKIIRSIVAGEKNPKALARHRDNRCKASPETIEASLTGNYQPEHLFALKQALTLYDAYQAQVNECDQEIQAQLARMAQEQALPTDPLPKPKHRTKQPNALNFDVRPLLYQLSGVDITQIHGIGPYLGLRLISECGTDLSKWPTEKHFTSWLTLSPGSKISGGKKLSSHTRKSNNRIVASLRLAATTVGRSQTALGAYYRRLAARIGKAKAVTATARKIAILFYNAMRFGMHYEDLGADHYEQRYQQRVLKNIKRTAEHFGYELVPSSQCVS